MQSPKLFLTCTLLFRLLCNISPCYRSFLPVMLIESCPSSGVMSNDTCLEGFNQNLTGPRYIPYTSRVNIGRLSFPSPGVVRFVIQRPLQQHLKNSRTSLRRHHTPHGSDGSFRTWTIMSNWGLLREFRSRTASEMNYTSSA